MAVNTKEQDRSRENVSGQSLRLLLVEILGNAERVLTIGELTAACEAEGVVFNQRASKLISDTLRWETRKGRVVRVARGKYRFGAAPRSTRWWIHQKVLALRARLALLRASARTDTAMSRSGAGRTALDDLAPTRHLSPL